MTGTVVQPTTQKTNLPSLTEVLYAKEREILKKLNCARPGVIVDYNPGDATHGPTCSVQIAQQQVSSTAPDGTQTLQAYPVIEKVPVWFLGGGNYIATMPVAAGNECLIIFCDREIDNWLSHGVQNGVGTVPTTDRLHDVSDAIVLVGLRSNPNGVAGFSTDAMRLQSIDYTGPTGTGECIEIAPGKITIVADEVVTHGRNKNVWDAGGTGFSYTPSQINTYTDGVTSNHNSPTPPEVAP